jgi:hypothetical protein
MTVEEVLAKHEQMLDDFVVRNFPGQPPIAEESRYREVVSGETIEHRPKLQALLRRIESPRVKALLIVEPQRLSRGDLEDIGRLVKLLRYTDTVVLTLQYAYDLRDERDRDQFERELKRGNEYLEYTKKILKNGRLASLAAGNYIGSLPPYGYDKTTVMDGKRRCHTLVENKEQADVVRLMFDLFVNHNMGRQKICNYLEEMGVKPLKGEHWSGAWVKTALQNVHYIGKVKWNWRKQVPIVEEGEIIVTRPRAKQGEYLIFEGRHAGIVPEDLFYAAQEKLGKNPRVQAKKPLRNPFAGVVFCSCGRAMVLRPGAQARGIADRYVCADQKHCGSGSCTVDLFTDKMIEILESCIEDFEVRVQNNEGESGKLHASMIKNLEKRLEELKEKELAQWDAQADPDPARRMPAEIFQQLNARLLKEKDVVSQALQHARETMPEPVNYEERVVRFRELLAALKDPEVAAARKNALIKACVERIVYHRAPIERGRVEGDFKPHAAWNAPPIELDVTLRV